MGKAVISIGYTSYIVEPEDALRIAQVMTDAERYEENGYGDSRTVHVWSGINNTTTTIQFISDDTYRMGKAAGKRDK